MTNELSSSPMPHRLTAEARAFIASVDNNFGLEKASPYHMLEQVILPMASSMPDVNHREKMEIVSGLRRARASLIRVALSGSDVQHLFGPAKPSDEANIRAIPGLMSKLQAVIDRITDNGEYTIPTSSNHKTSHEERAAEFERFVSRFEQQFAPRRATTVG